MITLDLSDIADLISSDEVEDMVAEDLEVVMTDIYTNLTDAPPIGTPIDQGTARNSWILNLDAPLAPEIYTPLAYMPPLADGHSKQVKPGWIDRAVAVAVRK